MVYMVSSNTSVLGTSLPFVCPPVTTILSPTTAAAPAARGSPRRAGSTPFQSRGASTRSEVRAVRFGPSGIHPPRTTNSPR